MKNTKKEKLEKSYYWVLALTAILALFGLTIIASASQIMAISSTNDVLYFFKKQLIFIALGTVLFIVFSRSSYDKLRSFTWPFTIFSLFLLLIVFIPGIGHSSGGAVRWISLGFVNIQPSEFAKIAAVFLSVHLMEQRSGKINSFKDLTPFLMVVVLAIIVIAQRDLGTSLLILMASFTVLFAGGIRLRFLSATLGVGFIAILMLIIFEPYRFKRLMSFINPIESAKEGGFQIIQSMIALGSGGLFGTGLAMSKQKFFFLPAAHTDFIMAIVGEELGFIGSAVLVIIFALLAITGFAIAYNVEDNYAKLLAFGLTAMIICQVMINMGAVVGILPITGVPLPFISYGGSSLFVSMGALGVLASIASGRKKGVRRT